MTAKRNALRCLPAAVFLPAAAIAMPIPVTLELLTDSFGNETSFQLIADPNGTATAVPFDTFDPFTPALIDGFASVDELLSDTQYTFTWQLDSGDFEFTINDSFGDGICCSFGVGSFTLTTPDNTFTGGEFASSASSGVFSVAQVAEPGTLALASIGLFAVFTLRRRARKGADTSID